MTSERSGEPEPAGYPQTDTSEFRAVTIFTDQIDASLVKADVETRDKRPNTDGTLTLVNERVKPIGKFEVQIKAIPSGKFSYSCPSELVGYSNICLIPVLLVCVDIENRKVYWKHIHQGMPEFKAGQKTFTVHFDEMTEVIDKSHQYIQMWKVILQRYQTLFKGAQVLQTEILKELSLTGIPDELVSGFQIYIETINSILDTEFKVLKPILFANVWKFGVAVFAFNDETVTFREYAIEKGNNGPLLVHVPSGFQMNGGVSQVQAETLITRFSVDVEEGGLSKKTFNRTEMLEPELKAKEFLYQVYRTGLEERFFKLGGTIMYKETIFAFVTRYHRAMGIDRSNELSLDRVQFAATTFLPAWYEVALERHGIKFEIDSPDQIPSHDALLYGAYPKVLDISEADVLSKIAEGNVESYPCLYFNDLYLRQVVEGIEILRSRGYSAIEYPYLGNGNFPLLADKSDENNESLSFNITLIVSNLMNEYHSFIVENGLHNLFLKKYMNPNFASALFVDLEEWRQEPERPKIYECILKGTNGTHPKFAIYFGQPQVKQTQQGLMITLNGKEYQTRYPFQKDMRSLVCERPLQEWVLDDLLRLDGETYNAAYDYLSIDQMRSTRKE